MENITRVQNNLREGAYNNNPHGSAEDQAILAGEYSFIMGQMEQILARKPAIWNEIRKGVSSDTGAERAWESTSDGVNEMGLRLRAKGIEKMMSALKSLIRLAEGEAHNLH